MDSSCAYCRDTVFLLWDVIDHSGPSAYSDGLVLVATALFLVAEKDSLGRIDYPWTTYYELSPAQVTQSRKAMRKAWTVVFGHGTAGGYGTGTSVRSRRWAAQNMARTTVCLPRVKEDYDEAYRTAVVARRIARRRIFSPYEAVVTAMSLSEAEKPVYGRPLRAAPFLSQARRIAEYCEQQAETMTHEERRELPGWEASWRFSAAINEISDLPDGDRLREGVFKACRILGDRIYVARYADEEDEQEC